MQIIVWVGKGTIFYKIETFDIWKATNLFRFLFVYANESQESVKATLVILLFIL